MSRVRCKRGREGIVCIGRVREPLAADANSSREFYVNGTDIWWRWYAPIEILSRSGFVHRQATASILGYKSSYNFRGFGERHSGLRQITDIEYGKIIRRFHDARPIDLRLPPIPHSRKKGARGKGGESAAHRKLKEFVAANPSVVIGEAGLHTLRTEYPFVTGDRADIVLADSYNRIVAVEIKPEVEEVTTAGPLQAIKYRFMLEWTTNREPRDSRAFLIAHKITKRVREQCAKYGIECYEVPRSEVLKWRKTVSRDRK
ncbi:MAG: hypothetical protein WC654_07055 [Patescibacteria group bacterium]